MLRVECEVYYPDTNERYSRTIDWDNYESRREFFLKSDRAIRDGGIVTTRREDR